MMRLSMVATFILALATTGNAAMSFIHPGALENKQELEFVKGKIKDGAQPWTVQYNKLKDKAVAGPGTIPAISNTDPQSKTNEDAQKEIAINAYASALNMVKC